MNVLNTKAGMIGAGVLVAGVLIYFYGRQIKDMAAGVFTGHNAVTEGTVYAGAGVFGTIGAATNAASGGALERFGSWIGGQIYDIFNPTYDPNQRLTSVVGGFVRPEDKPSSLR